MYGIHETATRYKDLFDKLSYSNKVVLNELIDCIDEKKLNRLAKKQIQADIAASIVDYQNRDESLENLLGSDMNYFCEKMCENAPKASITEKMLKFLRDKAAYSLILSLVVLLTSYYKGTGWFLEGIYALQLTGGILVGVLCLPLVCFRDAMRAPGNIIFPRNALSLRLIISMAAYSLLCIAAAISYVLLFGIYPSVLTVNGWNSFKLNVLAWVIISAVVFVISFLSERYVVRRNYNANYLRF